MSHGDKQNNENEARCLINKSVWVGDWWSARLGGKGSGQAVSLEEQVCRSIQRGMFSLVIEANKVIILQNRWA